MEEGLEVNHTTKVVTQYEEQLPEIQEKLEIYTDKVEDGKVSGNESEYDSAGSYSEEEHNGVKSHHSEQGTGSETDGSVVLEREEGDGQESVPQKKVDDDEDKKNPQYIPKRGTFYEHDDRTADDIEAVEVVETEKLDKDGKKKIWQDKKEKWSHDRFNDTEQMPKSKSELVTIYGYDIRNEDGPPRARRRRRYGRGPNKYTRNWEDEDAYNKPVTTTTPPRNKKTQHAPRTSDEEFPPLVENEELTSSRESMKQNETFRNNKENIRKSVERVESPPPEPTISRNVTQAQHSETHYNSTTSESRTQKFGSGRVSKPNKEIVDSDYKGFTTKTRLNRNMKNQQKTVPKSYPKKDDYIQSQNFTSKNNNNHDIEKQMSQLNVQDGAYKGNKQNNQRQSSMPPRLQMEQKGSKRYSSIRQRSLPETANPPILQHSNYYPNDYNQQTQGNQSGAQAILHQVANPINQISNTALAPLPQQVPVTTSILQAPPPFVAPPFPQPPTFLPAPVPAPAFLPQQTPQIINYVQTPPPFPQGYQSFPPQFNPVAVTQPAELYQPQGGITYYSTDQQIAQRLAPLKRPKAAIPIVAPPAYEPKAYSRSKDEDDGQLEYVPDFSSIE